MGGRGSRSSAKSTGTKKLPYYAPKELSVDEIKSYSDEKLQAVNKEQVMAHSDQTDIYYTSQKRIKQIDNYFKHPVSKKHPEKHDEIKMERKRRVRAMKVSGIKEKVYEKNVEKLEAQMSKRNISKYIF